jgi:hypothetical protein
MAARGWQILKVRNNMPFHLATTAFGFLPATKTFVPSQHWKNQIDLPLIIDCPHYPIPKINTEKV